MKKENPFSRKNKRKGDTEKRGKSKICHDEAKVMWKVMNIEQGGITLQDLLFYFPWS